VTAYARANLLLALVPAALLAGALGFQHLGGLAPCEMCLWQRWPHVVAAVAATVALKVPEVRTPLLWLAAVSVAVSGAIGVFHGGVEQGWWEGITTCAATRTGPGDFTTAMINAPLIRCDAVPWSFAGLSMAGWNALISLTTALASALLLTRSDARTT